MCGVKSLSHHVLYDPPMEQLELKTQKRHKFRSLLFYLEREVNRRASLSPGSCKFYKVTKWCPQGMEGAGTYVLGLLSDESVAELEQRETALSNSRPCVCRGSASHSLR